MSATGSGPQGRSIDDVFEAADSDGFRLFRGGATEGYMRHYPPLRCRVEGERTRVRADTGPDHGNMLGALHGGFILSLVDQVMFAGPALAGQVPLGQVVTLDAGIKFIGAGRIGRPIDSLVERVGETGRMIFLRGTMTQDDRLVATFEGTLRKIRPGA